MSRPHKLDLLWTHQPRRKTWRRRGRNSPPKGSFEEGRNLRAEEWLIEQSLQFRRWWKRKYEVQPYMKKKGKPEKSVPWAPEPE